MDSWNAIGKHWLQKYDNKFGVVFCSLQMPRYYRFIYRIHSKILLRLYTSMEHIFLGHVLRSLKITFQITTYLVTLISNLIGIHFFPSFLINNIFIINDIVDKKIKTCVENQTIFNRLVDERNWISDCAKKIKKLTRKFCKEIKFR